MTNSIMGGKSSVDTYGRRLRRVLLPLDAVEYLLTLDGTHSPMMAGWPEGAKIVGVGSGSKPRPHVVLYLYHPDFAPLPAGREPPDVELRFSRD
jgi:hypothetical protein